MTTSPLNGKTGEVIRWAIGVLIVLFGGYFAAQSAIDHKQADTDRSLAEVRVREQTHFEETQRSLIRIERFMERIEARDR